MIKRILKWTVSIVLVLALAGLMAFLYFIPPFFSTPPAEFTKANSDGAPPVTGIADPAQRAIAEHGRAIVVRTGCNGCHAANGPQGPDLTRYLAGGGFKSVGPNGTFVSRNLTPDPETGLARRTDDEVKRVLRSGVFADGHVVPHSVMPWGTFSNWTEEDRHAVVVYLRSLPSVRQRIPEPVTTGNAMPAGTLQQDYAFKDYSVQ